MEIFRRGALALIVSAGLLCAGQAEARSDSGAGDKAWLPTWYASPAPSPNASAEIKDLTIREIVHTTAGGGAVRIRLSNLYGKAPLHIARAYLANRRGGAGVSGGVALRFKGGDGVTIAPGADVVSDPVTFAVKPRSDLAISLYVPDAIAATTHLQQRSAIYFAHGDVADRPELSASEGPRDTWASWLFLSEVEVSGSPDRHAVIAFGDSITDGLGIDGDSATSWPDRLYERLNAAHKSLAVINAGITGNRLTRPAQWGPFGEKGSTRFDRDVLEQPKAAAVIVLIGITDIGQSAKGRDDYASAEEIEVALTKLDERAHKRGLKIYLGTLTPFKGAKAGYSSEEKDALRRAVNGWIREQKVSDGFADFDKALDDPANAGQMRPAYDSGDHLHPNSNGARAIADAIPLTWF
jgi:lysophospholipase L1-like esterase